MFFPLSGFVSVCLLALLPFFTFVFSCCWLALPLAFVKLEEEEPKETRRIKSGARRVEKKSNRDDFADLLVLEPLPLPDVFDPPAAAAPPFAPREGDAGPVPRRVHLRERALLPDEARDVASPPALRARPERRRAGDDPHARRRRRAAPSRAGPGRRGARPGPRRGSRARPRSRRRSAQGRREELPPRLRRPPRRRRGPGRRRRRRRRRRPSACSGPKP